MMESTNVDIQQAASAAESGLSLLEIYALLMAIGLVLVFVVVLFIAWNVISIKKKFEAEEAVKEEVVAVPAASKKQSSLAQKTCCPMCGKELREGAIFCDICGTRI